MGLLRLLPAFAGFGLSMLLALAAPGLAAAAEAPAHLSFVDGSVSLEREGQAQDATSGLPLLPGDQLRSTSGRLEILFPDGSALHLDEYSAIELLSETLLRMTEGRVLLIVAGAADPERAVRYQIDTPVASAVTDGPGEFRVALLQGVTGAQTAVLDHAPVAMALAVFLAGI